MDLCACMHGVVWHKGLSCACDVQLKRYRRGRKLVACFNETNRVVIHDLDTRAQKEIEVETPFKCASSQHYIAVTAFRKDPRLLTTDGALVNIFPESKKASCVAFHPRNTNIFAIGYQNGAVCMWDLSTQEYVSSFKQHTD